MDISVVNTIITTLFAVYFLTAGYQVWKYKSVMTSEAYHHLWSHIYMALFVFVGWHVMFMYGSFVPLIFAIAHFIQHIMKENARLTKTNRWTEDVHDEHFDD